MTTASLSKWLSWTATVVIATFFVHDHAVALGPRELAEQGADGVDGLVGRDLARGQVEGGGRQVREVIELRARTLLTLDSLLR